MPLPALGNLLPFLHGKLHFFCIIASSMIVDDNIIPHGVSSTRILPITPTITITTPNRALESRPCSTKIMPTPIHIVIIMEI